MEGGGRGESRRTEYWRRAQREEEETQSWLRRSVVQSGGTFSGSAETCEENKQRPLQVRRFTTLVFSFCAFYALCVWVGYRECRRGSGVCALPGPVIRCGLVLPGNARERGREVRGEGE